MTIPVKTFIINLCRFGLIDGTPEDGHLVQRKPRAQLRAMSGMPAFEAQISKTNGMENGSLAERLLLVLRRVSADSPQSAHFSHAPRTFQLKTRLVLSEVCIHISDSFHAARAQSIAKLSLPPRLDVALAEVRPSS